MGGETVQSNLERSFLAWWLRLAPDAPLPASEHRFHPVRRWRFDFAFPDSCVAVECEGGTWVHGRHTRGAGFRADCEKYNNAAALGWRVFRCTSDMLRDAPVEFIEMVKEAL